MADRANYEYETPERAAPTSPYGSGDPYYSKSSGYMASGAATAKSSKRNWLKFGIPIAVIVIVGAVVGGVLGSRTSKKNNNSSGDNNGNDNNGNGNPTGGPKNGLNRLPTSTDPFYGMPIYPSSVSLFPHLPVERGNIAVLNFLLSRLPDQLRTLCPAHVLHQFQVFLAERYLQSRESSTHQRSPRPPSNYRSCVQVEGPSEPHRHRAILLRLEPVYFPERHRLLQPSSCLVLHGRFQRYP